MQDAFRKPVPPSLKQHARRFARFALRIHLRGNDRHTSGVAAAFNHRRVKKGLPREPGFAVAQTELFAHGLCNERVSRRRFGHAAFVQTGENQMRRGVERQF